MALLTIVHKDEGLSFARIGPPGYHYYMTKPFQFPIVRKRKLKWFGHVVRSVGMAKTSMQGTVFGKRRVGRAKRRWEDNIMEWTKMSYGECIRAAENRERWRRIVWECAVPQRSIRLRDR